MRKAGRRTISLAAGLVRASLGRIDGRQFELAFMQNDRRARVAILPKCGRSVSARGRGVCGLLLMLVSTLAGAQLKLLDADNLAQAAGMAHAEAIGKETFRVRCGTDFPAGKAYFDRAHFAWTDANEDETAAADAVLQSLGTASEGESVDKATLAALTGMIDKLRADGTFETVCVNQVKALHAGDMNMAKRTPKASAFLKAYLVAHPRTAEAESRWNFLRGCQAHSLNKGTDFDEATALCTCLTEVHHTKLTEAERADHDRLARARTPAAELMKLPYMQRIQPDMVRCVAGS
jgi:hypothetical protein